MTFVVRLQISRRRRTKLPCTVTATVAIGSAFLCSLIVFILQKVPNVFFSFIVQCHKVSCDIYFDGLFRDIGLYFHHARDGNEKQGEPERGRSRMQQRSMANSCFKRLRQHRNQRLSKVASLVRSTMRRS